MHNGDERSEKGHVRSPVILSTWHLFSATWLAGSLQPPLRSAEMIHPRKGMNKHARLTAQTSILDEARACKGHEAQGTGPATKPTKWWASCHAASALPVQEGLPLENLKLPRKNPAAGSRDSAVAQRLSHGSSPLTCGETRLQHQSRAGLVQTQRSWRF